MQSKKLAGIKPGVPAQRYLDVAEIKEDTVILKDGTLRAVLLVSSINFALKSTDEQNAIIQSYMQFLNGLDFPLQIVIQSRHMNVDPYLQQLSSQETNITNDLLKKQIRDYRAYVKYLIKIGDIMQKRFFVVVPLNPATDKKKGFLQRLMEILTPSGTIRVSEERFRKQKFDLDLRVGQVAQGLSSMSLEAQQVGTQGLIELFYTVYNPELFATQPLADVSALQLEGDMTL